ncbi:SGNH/GDSL hydrolase family protein [Pseudomonas tolaasii]|uniref:SGNH/GDSL hydrolase family protein n=1 Tax=Pseudomonas tolaasii TaxID=29442 RepID=UPI0015A32550|nr:SGNH/GDSL hydrolase family protein [Pseudomonas tolaasii]NWC38338.1 SGNH/GDSL hydrolase family protein [Pseudomonas tolaasii]
MHQLYCTAKQLKYNSLTFKLKLIMSLVLVYLLSACAQPPKTRNPDSILSTADQISQSCELLPEKVIDENFIGEFNVGNSIPGWIEFSARPQDTLFNVDTLYKIDGENGSAFFRFSEKNFINGSMYLGKLTWVNNKTIKTKGKFRFYAVSVRKERTGKSLTMIGDSITWWSNGRYLRCLLSKQMTGVDFIGPHTDSFGFGHAGEGGNNTFEILARLDAIQASDYYFLLAGTNDWALATPEQSFENIKKIAETLSNNGGTVIVSTTLPRLDKNDSRNQSLNKFILSWGGMGCTCKVIDLYSEFSKVDDRNSMYWDEGIHPTIIGYKHIADILAPKLQNEIHSN